MRNITSMQLVKEMRLGWNLGNTLDSTSDTASVVPDETYWGNPLTTQAMLTAVKTAGFNTVRVPVTWQRHFGASPNFTVDAAWMARVEEIVNYVLSTGMYAILNSHHDEWVDLSPSANQTAVADQLAKLWTQIASRFKNYDDHLIFEVLNEPRLRNAPEEWTGGTPAARKALNAYNLAAVNAIRGTGGNNASRHIMVPTHGANACNECVNELVIPNGDAKVIVSLHTYYPWNFSAASGATTWGTTAERNAMNTELDRIANLLPKKGRAVVIGEWGSVNQNNTSARVTHARAYSEAVITRGMGTIWWDNGVSTVGTTGFGILDRKSNPPGWVFPEIMQALVAGATAGAAAAP
jgi:endoglucanase